MQIHEEGKKRWKKVKNQNSIGKTNFFLSTLPLSHWGSFSHMAWCSRKACEVCSLLIEKKKLKTNYFSLHKLPKLQSPSFWSWGILEVEDDSYQSRLDMFSTLFSYILDYLRNLLLVNLYGQEASYANSNSPSNTLNLHIVKNGFSKAVVDKK